MENNQTPVQDEGLKSAAPGTNGDGKKTPTPEEYRKSLELRKLEIDVAKGEMDLENLYSRADQAFADGAIVYNFFESVSEKSVSACINTLAKWSRLAPKANITLILNTPGGLVKEGLALFDYLTILKMAGHYLTVVALGRAASMGSILLQAGDRRLIGPNAFVLLHEISAGTSGKQSEMEDSVEFTARLQEKLLKILASKSNLTVRQIKARWKKTDYWLDAEETVAAGLADRILGTDPTDADYVRFAYPQKKKGESSETEDGQE